MSNVPSFHSLAPNMMVRNVDISAKFYKEILGFEQVMTVPETAPYDWAMLKQGEVTLMLQESKSFSSELPRFQVEKPNASLILYITTDSIDTLYTRLQSAEVKILKAPNVTFYGMKELTIEDLDGYTLVFAEPCEVDA